MNLNLALLKMELQLTNTYRKLLIKMVLLIVHSEERKLLKTLAPTWVPVKDRKGEFYNEWIDKVKDYGFNYGYRLLNAADYGSFTSRKRYFAQFNKPNMAIIWPDVHTRKILRQNFSGKREMESCKTCTGFGR